MGQNLKNRYPKERPRPAKNSVSRIFFNYGEGEIMSDHGLRPDKKPLPPGALKKKTGDRPALTSKTNTEIQRFCCDRCVNFSF